MLINISNSIQHIEKTPNINRVIGQSVTYILLTSIILYGAHYHLAKTLVHLSGFIALCEIMRLVLTGQFSVLLSRHRVMKAMSISLTISLLIVLFNTYNVDTVMAKRFSNDFIINALAFAACFSIMKAIPNQNKILSWAIPIAGLTMATPGVYEYDPSRSWVRISGNIDLPIIYASNLVLIAIPVLMALIKGLHNRQWLLSLLALTSFTSIIIAVILSGSRGPLLTIILIATAIIGIKCFQYFGKKVSILVSFLFISLLLASISQFDISKRLTNGIKNLSSEAPRNTSIGLRFEMWKGSLHAIKEHPIKGTGVGNHNDYFREKYINEPGLIHPKIEHFIHLHNDIINAITWMGIPGGILFLTFMFIPIIWSITKKLRSNSQLALALVSLAYILSGLTNTPSIRATAIITLLTLISLLLTQASEDDNLSAKEK